MMPPIFDTDIAGSYRTEKGARSSNCKSVIISNAAPDIRIEQHFSGVLEYNEIIRKNVFQVYSILHCC
jgi:hypothetical protein